MGRESSKVTWGFTHFSHLVLYSSQAMILTNEIFQLTSRSLRTSFSKVFRQVFGAQWLMFMVGGLRISAPSSFFWVLVSA